MSAALKDALDILFGKQLNPHYEAWRERIARMSGVMSRSALCDVCGERLFVYYACPTYICPQHRGVLCRRCYDQHYAVAHNPETHAMEP